MSGAEFSGSEEIKRRAIALIDGGQAQLAIELLTGPSAPPGTDPDTHFLLGHAELALSRPQDALLHLRRANAARKLHPQTLFDIARVHHLLGNLRAADAALGDLLRVVPDEGRAMAFRARMAGERGDPEAGIRMLDDAIGRAGPDAAMLTMLASLCQQAKQTSRGIDTARQVIDDPAAEPDLRRSCLFVLGHLLDAQGEYDDAFAAFSRANAMLPEGEASDIEQLRAFWTPEMIAELSPVEANASELPLLVVGMPRSGTTLTEQILASHPKITTVGESPVLSRAARRLVRDDLNDTRLGEIGKTYVDHLEEARSRTGKPARIAGVVDKMPENYKALGVASFALPAARVINCQRDARDTCLSIYFQDFGPTLRYATRLESVADEYRFYRAAMDHWRDHLDLKMLDWSYEALTAEPEPRVRDLLGFVGVPFDEKCLKFSSSKRSVRTASVSQVREGIYRSSTERWRRYERHIGPLLERLEDL